MSLANKLPKRIGKCNLMRFFAKDLVKRIMSMLLIPHDQCDQIRRNFTTLATFFKKLGYFYGFFVSCSKYGTYLCKYFMLRDKIL